MNEDVSEYIDKLDIQEIRLINGDHILAEVLWDRETPEVLIKDPIKLGNDINGVRTFVEWFSFTEDQYFSIDRSTIVASGSLDINTKLFFCRLIILKNIKFNNIMGLPQNEEELELLRNISTLMKAASGNVTLDEVEDMPNWEHEVDTMVKH